MPNLQISTSPPWASRVQMEHGNNESRKATIGFESRQLLVWFHETRLSKEDVIIDMDLIPGAKEGDVAELISLDQQVKEKRRKLLFIIKKISPEIQKKLHNVQVCL